MKLYTVKWECILYRCKYFNVIYELLLGGGGGGGGGGIGGPTLLEAGGGGIGPGGGAGGIVALPGGKGGGGGPKQKLKIISNTTKRILNWQRKKEYIDKNIIFCFIILLELWKLILEVGIIDSIIYYRC